MLVRQSGKYGLASRYSSVFSEKKKLAIVLTILTQNALELIDVVNIALDGIEKHSYLCFTRPWPRS